MNEFEKIVDSIVEEAFTNGFTTAYFRQKEPVLNRLKVFGYIKDGEYYLNEVGVKYAMDGYSEGIRNKKLKDSYISDLNIEATKKAMNDSDRAIQLSYKSLIVSAVSALIAFFSLLV